MYLFSVTVLELITVYVQSVPGSFVGWNSVVRVVTKLRAGRRKNRGSIPRGSRRFVLSPKRPHRLPGLPSLLFSGYRR